MNKSQKKKLYKILYTLILLLIIVLLKQFNLLNFVSEETNSIKLIPSKVTDNAKVTLLSCIDGDTAKFNINGEEKKVRFLAIDTPETVHPYKDVEEYGKSASEYTCNKLKNAQTIELQYEQTSANTDKYDRLLAWVFVDNSLLQKELVSIGYAKVRYIYVKLKYVDELLKAQTMSKQEKKGLWLDYKEEEYDSTKNYTITFKYDTNIQKIIVSEGSIVNLIDNPVKDGYEFVGWKKGSNLYDMVNPVTDDITLTASYKKLLKKQ